jgi:hypothetical protein
MQHAPDPRYTVEITTVIDASFLAQRSVCDAYRCVIDLHASQPLWGVEESNSLNGEGWRAVRSVDQSRMPLSAIYGKAKENDSLRT